VVEDVAKPVPLGRALQGHGNDIVGPAEAVRKALTASRRVRPGVEQGVPLLAGAVGAGLLAVGSAAIALAGGARAAMTQAGWVVAAMLAPLVLAPAALYTAIIPGILLRAIGGSDHPYSSAMSFQPGVLLVVVPAAAASPAGWAGAAPARR